MKRIICQLQDGDFAQQYIDSKNNTPNNTRKSEYTKQQSKQNSRNNSKISTPVIEESNFDLLHSQLNFTQNQHNLNNYMDKKTFQKILNSPNQKKREFQQFTQSQMNSRNNSQKKKSPRNVQQSRNESKDLEQFFQKQLTQNNFHNTSVPAQQVQNIKNMFNLQYVIGIGGFGKVWKVQHKKSNKYYAMKEMNKALIITKKSVSSVMNERKLLSQVKHPYNSIKYRFSFLVNMSTSFQDRDNLYLIMDFLSGGDLRYHVGRMRRFNEEQTRFMIACIFVSLECLHSKNIIHRDIKPENLVLDNFGYVRVTDLGIARIMRNENSADTSGTPGYMAPEVMCRLNHNYAVDYFALGVIAYEFMLGRRPYLGRTRKEIRDQILAKQIQIKKTEMPVGWSFESVDFINRLLQRKPQSRLGFSGAHEIKNHAWLKNFPWQKLLNKELIAPFIPNQREDNFDSGQISIEDEENNELIQQNIMLLRRNSVQSLFEGYSFEQQQPPIVYKELPKQSLRKSSLSSHTQGAYQPNMLTQKTFFNQVESLLRSSYQKQKN